MTAAEVVLWKMLRRNALGVSFRRQHPIGPFIADFVCLERRVIVELDGQTHYEFGQYDYDNRRDRYLSRRGFTILAFENRDLFHYPDGVLHSIRNALELD